MATGFHFLGQDITIGEYSGDPRDRTIITENAMAFSILNYFITNGGFDETSKVVICKNHNDENTFAIGYQVTDNYGRRCFFKWANSNDGLIPDNDTIPTSPPWNGWIMTGTNVPMYTGFDPDDLTLNDLLLNSIAFFQQNSLYPYYRKGYPAHDADYWRGMATVNLIICTGLKNFDGSLPANFTEPTPYFLNIGEGGFTNWIDTNNVTTPSYSLGDIGYGPQWIYSPLDCIGSWEQEHFDEDPSGPGGGWFNGDYGYGGHTWNLDDPITLSAVDTGFLSLFSPTKAQLQNLADYMWSSDLVDNLKKLYSDPMESIIMFGIVPLDLSSYRESMTSSVFFGNVNSGIGMYKLKSQYVKVDLGSITVPENWGSALDYSPFCSAQLYLPGCGFVPVKMDDIMASKISINYSIDLLSGDIMARVVCKKSTQYVKDLDAPTYLHRGNCMINVPTTGMNYANYYKTLMLSPLNVAQGMISGNPVGGIASGVAGATSGLLDGPDVQRSGNYGGSIAALCQRNPCLFIYRPVQQWPARYNEYIGYPSFITYNLSELKGFTQVDAVIDNTVVASDWEKAEIERLLKEGVIL